MITGGQGTKGGGGDHQRAATTRAAVAWALLRDVLELHDSETTGLALRTAAVGAALELDPRVCLPLWLTEGFLGDRHLAPSSVTSQPGEAALESPMDVDREATTRDGAASPSYDEGGRKQRRGGHPSKLLELYMNQGLLLPACTLVSQLLLAGADKSAAGETARYDWICGVETTQGQSVWLPYSHIDRLLHLAHGRVDVLKRGGVPGKKDDGVDSFGPLERALVHVEELLELHFVHLIMAEAIVSPTQVV